MTAQAKNLSEGQKRKLTIGIAILGDPKVPGVLIYYFFFFFFFPFTFQFFCITLRIKGLM